MYYVGIKSDKNQFTFTPTLFWIFIDVFKFSGLFLTVDAVCYQKSAGNRTKSGHKNEQFHSSA